MLAKKPLELVLASASQRRADLLGQIGVVPDRIVPANIDESPITGELPRQLVSRLSASKAILVSKKYPRSIILAADTVVACGRRVLSKPENLDQARSFLNLLSGRRHRVISGLAIISHNGNLYKRLVETHVNFKRLTSTELNQYLGSGEWEDKAGAYAIQGIAAEFIKSINGSYSNVVGLPLFETAQLLKGLGYY